MDISILLALQNFRNTTGAFLADFLSKMTFFGELNTTLVNNEKWLYVDTDKDGSGWVIESGIVEI